MKNIMNTEKSLNSKKYLNFEERKMIEKMIKEGLSLRKIGGILGKGKSTIGDEIKNNSTFHDGYKTELAHKKFLKNQLKKRNKDKIETNPKLQEYIISKLKEDWSPEEISGRLKKFHNDKNIYIVICDMGYVICDMFVLKLYINSFTQRIELNFDFLRYSEDINRKELNGTQENLDF